MLPELNVRTRAYVRVRDAVGFEFVFGPFAHIARQHRRNAEALQVGSDARLATAPLRRG